MLALSDLDAQPTVRIARLDSRDQILGEFDLHGTAQLGVVAACEVLTTAQYRASPVRGRSFCVIAARSAPSCPEAVTQLPAPD